MRYSYKTERGVVVNCIHGCWGKLNKYWINSNEKITEIDYQISGYVGNTSLGGILLFERAKKHPKESVTDATMAVTKDLCKAIFANRLTYTVYKDEEETVFIKFTDFGDMPRNHFMYLLFAIRNAITITQRKEIVYGLMEHGVKSTRKLFIGYSILSRTIDMYNEITHVSWTPNGGGTLYSLYTTMDDIKDFYRGKPLKGPADRPWSEGGGYSSGDSGRLVVASGARHLCHSDNPAKEGIITIKAGVKLYKDELLTKVLVGQTMPQYFNATVHRLALMLKNLK